MHKQLAALCHRKGDTGLEVLLVTSSEGRWILPKGWPIDGLDGHETALVEAWEEGGVKKAKAGRKPIGTYVDTKISERGDEEPCEVKVYGLKVQKTVDAYPEADRRDRVWVSPKKAAMLVKEEGLRDILLKL
jgi:8-oxo-dGTP pyrophosphatase MutT (NUDIX family)